MVHWPEVMMTCDLTDGILFSADAFGRFGTSEADVDWTEEARSYYFGIVGKYGAQVQALLKKLAAYDIKRIFPLHGNVLEGDLTAYLSLYGKWSSYLPEEEGVTVAYTSVYGNTRAAAERLVSLLRASGKPVAMYDLARCDCAKALADAFRYDTLILATTTYNAGIFPPMHEFIRLLTERGFRGRRVGIIENGSWAPMAAKTVRALLEGAKDVTFLEPVVTVNSALNETSLGQIEALAEAVNE